MKTCILTILTLALSANGAISQTINLENIPAHPETISARISSANSCAELSEVAVDIAAIDKFAKQTATNLTSFQNNLAHDRDVESNYMVALMLAGTTLALYAAVKLTKGKNNLLTKVLVQYEETAASDGLDAAKTIKSIKITDTDMSARWMDFLKVATKVFAGGVIITNSAALIYDEVDQKNLNNKISSLQQKIKKLQKFSVSTFDNQFTQKMNAIPGCYIKVI